MSKFKIFAVAVVSAILFTAGISADEPMLKTVMLSSVIMLAMAVTLYAAYRVCKENFDDNPWHLKPVVREKVANLNLELGRLYKERRALRPLTRKAFQELFDAFEQDQDISRRIGMYVFSDEQHQLSLAIHRLQQDARIVEALIEQLKIERQSLVQTGSAYQGLPTVNQIPL